MKHFVLSVALALAVCSSARAKTVTLKGAAADDFVSKNLPEADVPGVVKGTFRCSVPAMGARSDGAVSVCHLDY